MFLLDSLLSRINMYRLMIYFLLSLTVLSAILSFFGILPYKWADILLSALYLVVSCKIFNKIFAKLFKATVNLESDIITGLIIALIITPIGLRTSIIFLTLLAGTAMISKYVVSWKKRHIFNPAAFAMVASAVIFGQGASWWVSNPYTFPAILVGGFLILRKIKRFTLVLTFLAIYFGLLTLKAFALDTNPAFVIQTNLFFSPILFFAVVMLIEPATSPSLEKRQISYAISVAVLLILFQAVLKSIPYTLELALLTGNAITFAVSKKVRTVMKLIRKQRLAPNIVSFQFKPQQKFLFTPGQYMEWTLPHPNPDQRGIRRFFTISSSPTEKFIAITTKFPPKGKQTSTFKQALKALKQSRSMQAFGPDGNFVLPDKKQKLAFIAGGIGVTPFRSIIKYLLDKGERWDIILLYSASKKSEFVFKDVFEKAQKQGWLKVNYLTKRIDEEEIRKGVKDWRKRIFYVSGPEPMVRGISKILQVMGVKEIRHDYFPGYT